VFKEFKEKKENEEQEEKQDLLVHLVPQEREDLQETVVSLVLMDNKDPKEKLAVADVPVLRDLKVVLAIQDELESLDFLELGVLPANLVQKVVKDSSVQLDHQEKMVDLDLLVVRDKEVHQDKLDILE